MSKKRQFRLVGDEKEVEFYDAELFIDEDGLNVVINDCYMMCFSFDAEGKLYAWRPSGADNVDGLDTDDDGMIVVEDDPR